MTAVPSGGSNPTLTIMALALRMAWPLPLIAVGYSAASVMASGP